MQGAQKLRSDEHLQLRRNDEVEAQRRRWTFYETIKDRILLNSRFHHQGIEGKSQGIYTYGKLMISKIIT
jgi:hypothetical protein